MRIVALIDDNSVIERILRHLGLWNQGVRVHFGTDPPTPTVVDHWPDYDNPSEYRHQVWDDSFPDYDTEPVTVYANE